MMKRFKYLALAAMVAFAACDEEGGPVDVADTGNVTGTVTAEGTGIAGVTVNLVGATSQSATTSATGTFAFNDVPVGNYAVTISGVSADFACSSTSQSVTVSANATATVSFSCNIVRTASISGAVTSGANPVSGATVTATRAGGTAETRQTGANGQFQFTGLRSGSYTVALTPPAGVTCTSTSQTVNLVSGQSQIINFSCNAPSQAPIVTIESITVGGAGTFFPAEPDSIVGRVEVTTNIEPRGNTLTEFQLLARAADGTVYEICRQTFGAGAPPAEAEQQSGEDQDITCSWSTDRTRNRQGAATIRTATSVAGPYTTIASNINRPFNPIFLNGDYQLIARVSYAGTPTPTPVTATVNVTLRNMDAINIGVTADNTGSAAGGTTIWNDPTTGQPFPNQLIDPSTGLRWLSGDQHVTVFPIIYSAPFDANNPALARGALMFNGFVGGVDVTRGGTQLCQPGEVGCPQNMPASTTDGTFRFTFCEGAAGTARDGSACYARITAMNTGVIGARNITLQTITRFGQFGPTLADLKTLQLFDIDLQSGTRGSGLNDVLRIDNEGPLPGSLLAALLPHPANNITGVAGFSRTGLGGVSNLGWVRWADGLNGLVVDPASDIPNVFPAGATGPDQILGTADDVMGWCDRTADRCIAPLAPLAGIGLPAIPTPPLRRYQLFVRGPGFQDPSDGTPVAATVANIIAGATKVGMTLTGADLPPESGAGLTDQCPGGPVCSAAGTPNSDTELDYGIAAQHWDRFGNTTNSANVGAAGQGYLLLGVDGHSPIYSNGIGTVAQAPIDPTVAGSIWDPYDNRQHFIDTETSAMFGRAIFLAQKTPGALTGFTTDRANGFSGIAGVVVEDWESGCATGVLACAGSKRITPGGNAAGSRFGYTIQGVAPGGATTVLAFSFAGTIASGLAPGGTQPATPNTFVTGAFPGVSFPAYLASNTAPALGDGYRDQALQSYDRAGNMTPFDGVTEGIADHFPPQVGNVQMPTVVTFTKGTSYTYGGETSDNADLRKTDFSFDFNSIVSLQAYSDPNGGSGNPAVDADGRPFQVHSLQLPRPVNGAAWVSHTAFGSSDILLHTNLSVSNNFLACLVRFDERGVAIVPSGTGSGYMVPGPPEPTAHRPRGPRWRSWDHANPVGRHVLGGTTTTSAIDYGLVNTQFNTFTPSSVPTCTAVGAPPSGGAYGAGFTPALGSSIANPGGAMDPIPGWQFTIVNGRPTITLTGTTATFVPNVDLSKISLYYLDVSGRAILHDLGNASNWTLIVSDVGTGAGGRQWEFTYVGALPSSTEIVQPQPPSPQNGTVSGWFFVYEVRAGEGLVWDTTSNP